MRKSHRLSVPGFLFFVTVPAALCGFQVYDVPFTPLAGGTHHEFSGWSYRMFKASVKRRMARFTLS